MSESNLFEDDDFESIVAEQELSDVQKKRIERNKRKAEALKRARANEGPKEKDSGAGFFIPEEDDERFSQKKRLELSEFQEAPLIGEDMPQCTECENKFSESFLLRKFDYHVCDGCKDNDRERLITKTEAKKIFLLKDCDLESREPPLKFIVRKNPHNPRWGEMKLFLRYQVEARAIEVWGSEEALEEEIERIGGRKEVQKKKKFDKKIKELRMKVRGSLFVKKMQDGIHTHTYGEETYDEEEDEYSKTCSECGHVLTYEKM